MIFVLVRIKLFDNYSVNGVFSFENKKLAIQFKKRIEIFGHDALIIKPG